MNSKSLLVCLVILAVFASMANSLMIKKTQNHNRGEHMARPFGKNMPIDRHMAPRHMAPRHMASQFLMGVQHQMFAALHFDDDSTTDTTDDQTTQQADAPADDGFLNELIAFLKVDEEISGSLSNGKPLSKEAAGRVKDFFKNSKGFSDQMLLTIQDPSNPDCVKNLSEKQKRKLISIIIDQMDFLSILNPTPKKTGAGAEPGMDDASMKRIMLAIRNDPDLGEDFVKCYEDNSDTFSKVM